MSRGFKYCTTGCSPCFYFSMEVKWTVHYTLCKISLLTWRGKVKSSNQSGRTRFIQQQQQQQQQPPIIKQQLDKRTNCFDEQGMKFDRLRGQLGQAEQFQHLWPKKRNAQWTLECEVNHSSDCGATLSGTLNVSSRSFTGKNQVLVCNFFHFLILSFWF